MALYDDDITSLSRRAYSMGKERAKAAGIPSPTDHLIYGEVIQDIDYPEDYGEHSSDLYNPTDDDERMVAAAYRRGYHGAEF